jgi:hypothetical protein
LARSEWLFPSQEPLGAMLGEVPVSAMHRRIIRYVYRCSGSVGELLTLRDHTGHYLDTTSETRVLHQLKNFIHYIMLPGSLLPAGVTKVQKSTKNTDQSEK